jgi:hypothetical protein
MLRKFFLLKFSFFVRRIQIFIHLQLFFFSFLLCLRGKVLNIHNHLRTSYSNFHNCLFLSMPFPIKTTLCNLLSQTSRLTKCHNFYNPFLFPETGTEPNRFSGSSCCLFLAFFFSYDLRN